MKQMDPGVIAAISKYTDTGKKKKQKTRRILKEDAGDVKVANTDMPQLGSYLAMSA